MVGSAGEGIGSHGFSCGPDSGSRAFTSDPTAVYEDAVPIPYKHRHCACIAYSLINYCLLVPRYLPWVYNVVKLCYQNCAKFATVLASYLVAKFANTSKHAIY